jgi:cell division septal protein FtsQ
VHRRSTVSLSDESPLRAHSPYGTEEARSKDVEREQAPVFRRRRFAAPHRRRKLWVRLLRPFATAALIVGLPAGAGFWVATSPMFRVDEIIVSSGDRVPSGWAEGRLQSLAGRHVLRLGLSEVEARLRGHPWFRGAEMSKRLPAYVEVRILERNAVALLRTPNGLSYLDSSGQTIAPYETAAGEGDFVVITAGSDGEAAIRGGLDVATAWSRVAGSWAVGLSEVETIDALSFRLYVSDLEFPLLVTEERLEKGVAALRRVLPRLRPRYPTLQFADLRYSGQVVFQPAGGPPTEG